MESFSSSTSETVLTIPGNPCNCAHDSKYSSEEFTAAVLRKYFFGFPVNEKEQNGTYKCFVIMQALSFLWHITMQVLQRPYIVFTIFNIDSQASHCFNMTQIIYAKGAYNRILLIDLGRQFRSYDHLVGQAQLLTHLSVLGLNCSVDYCDYIILQVVLFLYFDLFNQLIHFSCSFQTNSTLSLIMYVQYSK